MSHSTFGQRQNDDAATDGATSLLGRVYAFAGDDEGREPGQVEIAAKGHDGYVVVRRLNGGEVFLAAWDTLTPAGSGTGA